MAHKFKSPQTKTLIERLDAKGIKYHENDGGLLLTFIMFTVDGKNVGWESWYNPDYGKGYTHNVAINGKKSSIKAVMALVEEAK